MPEKTIALTIDEQGNTTLDLNGFVGTECEKAFEDFRGRDLVKIERRKPAYYTHGHAERQKSQR